MKKKPKNKRKINFKGLPHQKLTFGQKASDKLTEVVGSWGFITGLIIIIGAWVFLNITAFVQRWDPWPFILLNLFLSCIAALQAPIILMSQNRANQRDRIKNERDFAVNRKAERQVEKIRKELVSIKRLIHKK